MSDAQQEQDDGRKPFGRKQLIGMASMAVPLAMLYILVFLGKVSGTEFMGFCQYFIPIMLGAVIGLPAAVSGVQALKK